MTRRPGTPFLLEIGTEEIPARMIDPALEELRLGLLRELEGGRLLPGGTVGREDTIRVFGAPRRLAVLADGLLERQPDSVQDITGPPVKAAYDAAGAPTGAAVGFARAQGVAVGDLQRLQTPKGECAGLRRKVPGRSAAEILAAKVPPLVLSLSFPKTMRWGRGEHRFVRPVHWVVAIFGGTVVDLTILGIRAGGTTRGHRHLGSKAIVIPDPLRYQEILRAHRVIADIGERRELIRVRLEELARARGASIAAPPGAPPGTAGDPDLLGEVTQSAAWPDVIEGEFAASFLALPRAVLVTAMRHHQKSFSLQQGTGRLLNAFAAVADTEADRGAIRKGHEWVLRARLADARFFWHEDRRRTLREHAAGLARVTFQEKLGSYARKTERMLPLSAHLTRRFDRAGVRVDGAAVEEAVRLCKADLTTQMVNEFPELEGIVGGLYARADGLGDGVAASIAEHYLPRGTDDPLPSTPEAAVLSLADRLDTQAGIFLLGVVPTGSRDPYGLRRSVLGACRILFGSKVRMSLREILGHAFRAYADAAVKGAVPAEDAMSSLLDFYRGRLQYLGEEDGRRPDTVRSALAASMDDPYDARMRMAALDAVRSEPGFETLARAHKRIKNILQGQDVPAPDPSRLKEDAERDLDRSLRAALPAIAEAQERLDHAAALREIARLAGPLDRFFAEVLVMAEDPLLRASRLGLLKAIAALFVRVGDFSEIVVEQEPTGPAGGAAAASRREAGRR